MSLPGVSAEPGPRSTVSRKANSTLTTSLISGKGPIPDMALSGYAEIAFMRVVCNSLKCLSHRLLGQSRNSKSRDAGLRVSDAALAGAAVRGSTLLVVWASFCGARPRRVTSRDVVYDVL
jgi:hypothetical protein